MSRLACCHLTRPMTEAVQAGGFAIEPMGARYLPLPHADAATLSKVVLATTQGGNLRAAG